MAESGYNQLVWNPDTLIWEPMVQPATEAGGGGGGAVTIADGDDTALGATTDAAVTTDTTGTVSGKLRGLVKWTAERMPAALGQTTMAGSFPVVIASNQSEVLVADGDVFTELLFMGVDISLLPDYIGNQAESAPATDTGVSGLNGRLQRIAQRLTSLIALLPSSLVSGRLNVHIGGSAATVTVADDGAFATQPTETRPDVTLVTSVAASATAVELLDAETTRRMAAFYNDSSSACYLKLGLTDASTSSFTVKMAAGSYYEVPYPCYTGRISAIWDSATGNMRITEMT